jgi:hypothetical protein
MAIVPHSSEEYMEPPSSPVPFTSIKLLILESLKKLLMKLKIVYKKQHCYGEKIFQFLTKKKFSCGI